MRHTSVKLPSSSGKKSKHKHLRSPSLSADARVTSPPRLVEVVNQRQLAKSAEIVFLIKIYGSPGVPGSELMTVACVDSSRNVEVEMRFDEKYPMSFRFKSESDAQRLASATEQIKRVGGFEELFEDFLSRFPEFGE